MRDSINSEDKGHDSSDDNNKQYFSKHFYLF